jgi:hypothetical protein
MFYIQRLGQGYRETVDEATTRQGARILLSEYALSDRSASYYISSRACKGWEA